MRRAQRRRRSLRDGSGAAGRAFSADGCIRRAASGRQRQARQLRPRQPKSDRISADEAEVAVLAADVHSRLSEYSRLRRRRDRLRRFRRGAIGAAVVLCAWQVMAVAYNLEQILPPPLTVAKTIINALTLQYAHPWTYGPNIY